MYVIYSDELYSDMTENEVRLVLNFLLQIETTQVQILWHLLGNVIKDFIIIQNTWSDL